MALLEQQATQEIRVQLVFLDFQVWMAYLGIRGLLDPEANLAWMATMALEVNQVCQENEEFLAQEACQAFLGKREKKEIQCSFQVVLKAFRATEGNQDHLAYQDQGVLEDLQVPWDILELQGCRDLLAALGAQV